MLPELSRNRFSQTLINLFQQAIGIEEDIRLEIEITSHDIVLRELSSFLLIIDHFYGRFDKNGYQSYASSHHKHLKADEIKVGSIVVVIEQIIEKLGKHNAVYFFLLIKFLPSIIKSTGELLLNISTAHLNYEKAKITRSIRKGLRQDLRNDELLQALNENEISKLAALLEKQYLKEKKLIRLASRLTRNNFLRVNFRKTKK